MDNVRFLQRLAVHEDLLVDELDPIARQSDAALHVIHGDERGMLEHDDVAALHILIRQQVLAEGVCGRIRQLVHDQVVAG